MFAIEKYSASRRSIRKFTKDNERTHYRKNRERPTLRKSQRVGRPECQDHLRFGCRSLVSWKPAPPAALTEADPTSRHWQPGRLARIQRPAGLFANSPSQPSYKKCDGGVKRHSQTRNSNDWSKAYCRENQRNAETQLKPRPRMAQQPTSEQSCNRGGLAAPSPSIAGSTSGLGITTASVKLARKKTTAATSHIPPPYRRSARNGIKAHKATIKTIPRRTGPEKRAYFTFTVPRFLTACGVSRLGIQ
jgi:hypothetical protein